MYEMDFVANVLRLTNNLGEQLPKFPHQTHVGRFIAEAAGIKPFTSAAGAFKNISKGASDNQHPRRIKVLSRKQNGMRDLHFVRRFLLATLATIPIVREVSQLVKLLACKDFQTIISFLGLGQQIETDRKCSPTLHGRTDITGDHQIVNGDGCERRGWI